MRLRAVPDYYQIDGRSYGCYLYARYLRGARPPSPPPSWLDAAARAAARAAAALLSPMRAVYARVRQTTGWLLATATTAGEEDEEGRADAAASASNASVAPAPPTKIFVVMDEHGQR